MNKKSRKKLLNRIEKEAQELQQPQPSININVRGIFDKIIDDEVEKALSSVDSNIISKLMGSDSSGNLN